MKYSEFRNMRLNIFICAKMDVYNNYSEHLYDEKLQYFSFCYMKFLVRNISMNISFLNHGIYKSIRIFFNPSIKIQNHIAVNTFFRVNIYPFIMSILHFFCSRISSSFGFHRVNRNDRDICFALRQS